MMMFLLMISMAGIAIMDVDLDRFWDDEDDPEDTNEGSPPAEPFAPDHDDTVDFPTDNTGAAPSEVLTSYRSGEDGGYNVDIEFEGDWTAEEQQAVISAADFISDLIVDDVPADTGRGQTIDDLSVTLAQENIDGQSGILGYAQVVDWRSDSSLPSQAEIVFDAADVEQLMASGGWDSTVMHEMFHALGTGVMWDDKGLVDNSTPGAGLRFTGENAIEAYKAGFPDAKQDAFADIGVPVEQDGGPGTAASHWDEETFGDEFMTGYLDGDDDFISIMSIAALEDLGYDTVYDDVTRSDDAVGRVPVAA